MKKISYLKEINKLYSYKDITQDTTQTAFHCVFKREYNGLIAPHPEIIIVFNFEFTQTGEGDSFNIYHVQKTSEGFQVFGSIWGEYAFSGTMANSDDWELWIKEHYEPLNNGDYEWIDVAIYNAYISNQEDYLINTMNAEEAREHIEENYKELFKLLR